MVQITNLSSQISEVTQNNKNDLLKATGKVDGLSTAFGELVFDSFNRTTIQAVEASDSDLELTSLEVLSGQIEGLQVETKNLLGDAENTDIDDILSKGIAQLWILLESFDEQNGTSYTLELSQAVIDASLGLDIETLKLSVLTDTTLNALGLDGFPLSAAASNQPILNVGQDTSSIVKKVSNFLGGLGGEIVQKTGPIDGKPMYMVFPVLDANRLGKNLEVQSLPNQQLFGETLLDRGAPPLQQAANITSSFNVSLDLKIKDALLKSAQITVFGKDNSLRFYGFDDVITPIRDIALPSLRVEQQFNNAPSNLQARPNPTVSYVQNLTSQIQSQAINEGVTRIELSPRGLGNILIDLQKQETGGMQVIMRAENPAVLNVLRTDRDTLINIISDGNAFEKDVSLDFEGFDQGTFQNEDHDVNGSLAAQQSPAEDDQLDTVNLLIINEAGKLNIIT